MIGGIFENYLGVPVILANSRETFHEKLPTLDKIHLPWFQGTVVHLVVLPGRQGRLGDADEVEQRKDREHEAADA